MKKLRFMARMTSVCVIGAGPSGLTSAKTLSEAGFEVTVYELGSKVGGNWAYSEDQSHSSVFETTHIISSKKFSQYADFPMPDWYPDYPSHVQLYEYFCAYADRFDLIPLIKFRTKVVQASQVQDGWNVTTIDTEGQETQKIFDSLVVSNGHHWKPRLPSYPGKFTGEVIHSHAFKKADPFKGKRVLVVGGGNSACDVAVESSRVAAHVSISMRRGYLILPKFTFGLPSDHLYEALGFLPNSVRAALAKVMIYISRGSNGQYGLKKALAFGRTHPTINSELFYFIRHGKIMPQEDIDRLSNKTVFFKDGSQREFDCIVYCTGYEIRHPFLEGELSQFEEKMVPLYLKMFHPEYSNLFFVGLFQPLGCIWPLAELQAKILAPLSMRVLVQGVN